MTLHRRELLGALGAVTAALLTRSLQYIQALGVERIVTHRKPLIAKLRAELPVRACRHRCTTI